MAPPLPANPQRVAQLVANLHPEPEVAKNKVNRIVNWRRELPANPADFVDAAKDTRELTTQYHITRLEMCVEYSRWALSELDKYEHQYRVIGYKYHRVPIKARGEIAKVWPQGKQLHA